jgi:MFS superfamily sulfate permease-like transporter
MDGFVTGLAIFVAVGQLNKLFGVAKPEGNTVEKLLGVIKELPHGQGIAVYLADVHAPVLDYSRKMGLLQSIGEDHVFPTVDAAVRHVETTA